MLRLRDLSAVLLLSVLAVPAGAAINSLSAEQFIDTSEISMIDARPLQACLASSVRNALCLPASDFYSQPTGLASFRDISWAFGTAGLTGSQAVLVFADSAHDRDLVAALLHLAGQADVWLWEGRVESLKARVGQAVGRQRGIVRSALYAAPMRDELLALPSELNALVDDGWRVLNVTQTNGGDGDSSLVVVAEDPIDALRGFTRLVALQGDAVKVVVDPVVGVPTSHVRSVSWVGWGLLFVAALVFVGLSRGRRSRS